MSNASQRATGRSRLAIALVVPLATFFAVMGVDRWSDRQDYIKETAAAQHLLTGIAASGAEARLEQGQLAAPDLVANYALVAGDCRQDQNQIVDEVLCTIDQPIDVVGSSIISAMATTVMASTAMVIDRVENIVGRQPEHDLWASPSSRSLDRTESALLLPEGGNVILPGLDDLKRSYTYGTVPDFPDLTVAASVPLGSIDQQSNQTLFKNIAIGALIATLAIVTSIVALRRAFTTPIAGLVEFCQSVADGDAVKSPDDIRGPAEFAQLGAAFTAMRDDLLASEHALRTALQQTKQSAAEQRLVWTTLETARTEQRLLAAPALHDDTIQVITSLAYQLGTLARHTSPELADELIGLETEARNAVERLRLLLFELTPIELEEEGLASAIVDLAQRLQLSNDALAVNLDVRLAVEPPPDVQALLFLVAREALTNVHKHAKALTVVVGLRERAQGWQIRVADDGRGLDTSTATTAKPGHMGLAHLNFEVEHAGGWLHLTSTPHSGTVIEVWLPPTPLMTKPNAASISI